MSKGNQKRKLSLRRGDVQFEIRTAPQPRPFADVLDALADLLIAAAERDGDIERVDSFREAAA